MTTVPLLVLPPPTASSSSAHRLLPALEAVAARSPASPALLGLGIEPICYADVVAHVHFLGARLRSLGFAPGDRIAVALPDSPAAVLVAVSLIAHCAAAPVNPRATVVEVGRLLGAVGARAVVVAEGSNPAARRAATAMNLPVLELRSSAGPAGRFDLQPVKVGGPAVAEAEASEEGAEAFDDATRDVIAADAGPGDPAALVIYIAAAPGFPKVVALTQDNLLSMVLANCEVLGLTPLDRCLTVEPLCHLQGLTAVLGTLVTGGSAAVLPGFNAAGFYEAFAQFSPTWYTATPAIHQAVLDHASDYGPVVRSIAERKVIRFIRSASAAMPAGVPERLEKLFDTVYVEAYGAAESSGLICSNRPGRGRVGSAGLPAPGNEVSVVDVATGQPAGANCEGELIVRGPGVCAGYEDNPFATEAAFPGGAFRTGDIGRRDEDGFFYITGRLKNQINRAGETVSPFEVEDALLSHPDVVQAVAFGFPDASVGEEIGCAVVLRTETGGPTELELQRHVGGILADYKVPRRVVFVGEVPVGPDGKVSRPRLAQQLALGSLSPAARDVVPDLACAPFNDPVTTTEQVLAAIWSAVIGRRVADVDAPFERLGVDSLQALKISLAIELHFARAVPVAAMWQHRSIRAVAGLLERDGWQPGPGAPVVLRAGSSNRPVLFVVPGVGRNAYDYYALTRRLPPWQRVVVLPLPGADGLEAPLASVDALADRFTGAVRREQPKGPYLLSGDAFGGLAAFEVARRLVSAGEDVNLLAVFDTPAPGGPRPVISERLAGQWARALIAGPASALRRLAGQVLGIPAGAEFTDTSAAPDHDAALSPTDVLSAACRTAAEGWSPQPLSVRMLLLRGDASADASPDAPDATLGWSALAAGVEVASVPGKRGSLFNGYGLADVDGRIAAAVEGAAPGISSAGGSPPDGIKPVASL